MNLQRLSPAVVAREAVNHHRASQYHPPGPVSTTTRASQYHHQGQSVPPQGQSVPQWGHSGGHSRARYSHSGGDTVGPGTATVGTQWWLQWGHSGYSGGHSGGYSGGHSGGMVPGPVPRWGPTNRPTLPYPIPRVPTTCAPPGTTTTGTVPPHLAAVPSTLLSVFRKLVPLGCC